MYRPFKKLRLRMIEICYDAFVLDNKKTGIYYQATT